MTIVGKGKFEGMRVCGGTKGNVTVVIKNNCPPDPVSFETDSWETIAAAVHADNTLNYNVGDTKVVDLGLLGTHTVRIANKSACDGILASETACGFVIEFADIITTYNMNLIDTNVGGWKTSEMRVYVNNDIYNALVNVIGNEIIDTTVVSGHESGKTSNYTTIDKVYILSTREVYGKEGTSNTINYDTADADTVTKQLDFYKNSGVTTLNYSDVIKKNGSTVSYWWLRTPYSNSTYDFYFVTDSGDWIGGSAFSTYGVSPAFRLG